MSPFRRLTGNEVVEGGSQKFPPEMFGHEKMVAQLRLRIKQSAEMVLSDITGLHMNRDRERHGYCIRWLLGFTPR